MADEIASTKKRRDIIRGSLDHLGKRLKEVESRVDLDPVSRIESARQIKTKVEYLDSEFKTHHLKLIDLLESADDLVTEQGELNSHDDLVGSLLSTSQCVINRLSTPTPAPTVALITSTPRDVAARQLIQLRQRLIDVDNVLAGDPKEECVLQQLEEEITDIRSDLKGVTRELAVLGLADGDDLMKQEKKIREDLYGYSLRAKRLLSGGVAPHTKPTGVKLPKIDVPRFDGNVLNWHSFWDQYSVAIHSRISLSDAEKLAYLRTSLSDGPAKTVIEGLRSSDHYDEAVKILKARYDRPRLVHQTHVRLIAEAPSLKDGSGRELRKLHDTVQQHLRALKAMGHEPSGAFITSLIELKLDTTTIFEWQRASQDKADVPHYSDLLTFLDLRAQASEAQVADSGKKHNKHEFRKNGLHNKVAPSFQSSVKETCVACKATKHHLFSCPTFQSLSHEDMMSLLKSNNYCLNCLRPGHFVRQCPSSHRCRQCQGLHHTLLHVDSVDRGNKANPPKLPEKTDALSAHVASGLKTNSLLMTCRVTVSSPNGRTTLARGLLDSASSVSFISERLAQQLGLSRARQSARISGVAGISHHSSSQSIAFFTISSAYSYGKQVPVTAIVVPKVTCDLPIHSVTSKTHWKHLTGIQLADPEFGKTGRVDLLLGIDVFIEVLMQGRRKGNPGLPTAVETTLGWVLAGEPGVEVSSNHIVSLHTCATSDASGDDILRRFWEIEECIVEAPVLSAEEKYVVKHFHENRSCTPDGRYVVPLPKKLGACALGESRSTAVRRFHALERSLYKRGQFEDFSSVIQEYLDMNHAEQVPSSAMGKPPQEVFYLPMQVVRKESSTTTKIRAVFDASSKSSTGVSLNDILLTGPTVHATLVDVLYRFRLHRIALTTDVSRMYRAVALAEEDRDLHRFIWRNDRSEPLRDYRMTRLTFGVSSSSFVANMCIKQNALDHSTEYPLAAKMVHESFYVDDGLIGADSVERAVTLQKELQELFSKAGFLLRKWNASNSTVLEHIPIELRDSTAIQNIGEADVYTKTLGIEWNAQGDYFRLVIAAMPATDSMTKRKLISDIAKTFDVMGWFSPTIISMKILLQQTWERKIGWDDAIPEDLRLVWEGWRSELSLLSRKEIPRCYIPQGLKPISTQLHGFSDASEVAYAGVVYLRFTDATGKVHISLVTSKSRVAPIKRLTIPRLELCGANLLANIIHHVQEVLQIPTCDLFCWTDSTIVLSWLEGSPRRFKTYVGNRVSRTVELVPPERWEHVEGIENPADCASRGVSPSQLLEHQLWWEGPRWLKLDSQCWPKRPNSLPVAEFEEDEEVCLISISTMSDPVVPLDKYSSLDQLFRITAWTLRFISNCHLSKKRKSLILGPLSVSELNRARNYWIMFAQQASFTSEINALKSDKRVPRSSPIRALNAYLDNDGLLRVGGREEYSNRSRDARHPLIIHAKHHLARLLITSEHKRLLHAGPSLLTASLSSRFHIVRGRSLIRSITRSCVICRRSAKPRPPLMGQLPPERVTPDIVFSRVGIDYAGPILTKLGAVRRPTIVKSYIAVFVSLTVKAVHLEVVSDLSTDAFIACLRRFAARRGKPDIIWSDHGSNFVGAKRQLSELHKFLNEEKTKETVACFCNSQGIDWSFIPEHAPHFGGLWEAAVKSTKRHLSRVVGNVKLTFEELATVLSQIEACLNSRPLISLPSDDDNIQVLTPGHFLIGRPLESIPDPPSSYRAVSILRRWELCQSLVRHFWQRWHREYLSTLQKLQKWHVPTRNMAVGDIVLVREDGLVPCQWPLARIVNCHPGKDGVIRVVDIKTSTGAYTRPVHKVVLLLPQEL